MRTRTGTKARHGGYRASTPVAGAAPPHLRAARAAALAGALCVLLAAPGPVFAAGTPSSYRFPEGVRNVSGGGQETDAPALAADTAYRSVIKPGGKLYFRLVLDDKKEAYASAVALPGPAGAKLAYGDSVRVSIQDADGETCDAQRRSIGSAQYPHPFAAYAYRAVRPSLSTCQEPGSYYMVVERESDPGSTTADWGLDLRYSTEPTRAGTGPGTAPSGWPSASPAPPAGAPRRVHGGTGFHDAAELSDGQWKDAVRPGETLFFRVPLDWGRQLFVSGGLDAVTTARTGYVGTALSLQLYNPERGPVAGASAPYDGRSKEASLDPLAPVAYENRYAPSDETSAMRINGPYYLAVSLSPEVGQTFGDAPYDVTLKLTVRGAKAPAPAYAGPAPDFGPAGPAAGAASMKLLAALGIGSGTVLLAGLGVWTVVTRRRAAAGAPGPGSQGFGPPGPW
ncbi:hypothetical protein [Streptomyces sp. NBC_00083]|uniref:hypothetical protein n=1 Tax=Streptomyces sp. NBC_00083 TaxID=2975647 RepID=UPI00225549D8|nr:hypothetical protein [Streptomyces sp. NBC_00083]MCX5387536.1 hypothetical protein [Streptomyces sp. NBC_00083]